MILKCLTMLLHLFILNEDAHLTILHGRCHDCWPPGDRRNQQVHKLASADLINSLRPRQNVRHFADDTFKRFFQNENVWISIKISLKFVPKAPINNIPSLVQIMAWRRRGDKPLSEPMMVNLLTHICVTRPQWVNRSSTGATVKPLV